MVRHVSADEFKKLFNEGHGVCEIYVVKPQTTVDLLIAKLNGNRVADAMWDGIEQWLGNKKQPCLLCGKRTRPPKAFIGVVPFNDQATAMMLSALCHRCITGDESLEEISELVCTTHGTSLRLAPLGNA